MVRHKRALRIGLVSDFGHRLPAFIKKTERWFTRSMDSRWARVVIVMFCISLVLDSFGLDDDQSSASSGQISSPAADIDAANPVSYPLKFVVYGDMRFAKKDSYARHHIANSIARREILDDIARKNPAFVMMTGDMVFRGCRAEDWDSFRQGIGALVQSQIPIYPAIGNHEERILPFCVNAEAGLRQYYKQFPYLPTRRGWYSLKYGNCYFLVLDSQADDSKSSRQAAWVMSQLNSISPDIDYVFVVLHRPPHTAAADNLHRARPQERDLAAMLEGKQAKLHAQIIVIAGHVHNYERYEFNHVQYIVSGGGGAEPLKFTRSNDDLFRTQDPLSSDQYHYCLITVDHSDLKFEMWRLNEKQKFEVKDHFFCRESASQNDKKSSCGTGGT